MGRLGLAFRAFFAALGGSLTVPGFDAATAVGEPTKPSELPPPAPAPKKAAGAERSDAISLLAALQREARLVDLVQEPLGDYSDEQIGAAARDVLRDCRAVLDRMFTLHPVMEEPEDAEVETPAKFSPGRIRIRGAAHGDPPFRGRLVHAGWEAGQCELPKWSGESADGHVVAPAEIEL